jgi:hypothetical protein
MRTYFHYPSFYSQASIRPKKYPPGPPCIAFLGSLPYLDVKNLSKSFSDLAKKYGDVFSIFIGTTPVVVVNGWHLIKEVFERPEFSGRPGNFSGTFFQKGKTGITTTEGKHWSTQRKFLVDYLATVTASGHHGVQGCCYKFRVLDSLLIPVLFRYWYLLFLVVLSSSLSPLPPPAQ